MQKAPLILELFSIRKMSLVDTKEMNIRLQVREFELQIAIFYVANAYTWLTHIPPYTKLWR